MQNGNELKTVLRDHTLWYDGTVEVDPNKVADMLLAGFDIDSIGVTEVNDEIKQFNFTAGKNLHVKTECKPLNKTFLIPDEYKTMDLHTYFLNKQEMRGYNDFENERRLARIENELLGFEERNYLDVLRAIIYMIDVFREKKVVWGVGRGSSCASYLLFLAGVHLVDPVKYGIHYSEFLHD